MRKIILFQGLQDVELGGADNGVICFGPLDIIIPFVLSGGRA